MWQHLDQIDVASWCRARNEFGIE